MRVRFAALLLFGVVAGAGCRSTPPAPPPFLGTWHGEAPPGAYLRFDADGTLSTWTGRNPPGSGVTEFRWTQDGDTITTTVRDPRQGSVTQKFRWGLGADGKLSIHSTDVESGRTIRHGETYVRVAQ